MRKTLIDKRNKRLNGKATYDKRHAITVVDVRYEKDLDERTEEELQKMALQLAVMRSIIGPWDGRYYRNFVEEVNEKVEEQIAEARQAIIDKACEDAIETIEEEEHIRYSYEKDMRTRLDTMIRRVKEIVGDGEIYEDKQVFKQREIYDRRESYDKYVRTSIAERILDMYNVIANIKDIDIVCPGDGIGIGYMVGKLLKKNCISGDTSERAIEIARLLGNEVELEDAYDTIKRGTKGVIVISHLLDFCPDLVDHFSYRDIVAYENKQIYRGISKMRTTLGNGRYVRINNIKKWHSEYRPVSQARRKREQGIILPIEVYTEQRPIRMVGPKSFALIEYMLRIFREDIVPIKVSDANYSQDLCDRYVQEMGIQLARVEECDYLMISDWGQSQAIYEKPYKIYDVRLREFHDRQDISLVHSISNVPRMLGYRQVLQTLGKMRKKLSLDKGILHYNKSLERNVKYWYQGTLSQVQYKKSITTAVNIGGDKVRYGSAVEWIDAQSVRIEKVRLIEGFYSYIVFQRRGCYRFVWSVEDPEDSMRIARLLDTRQGVIEKVVIMIDVIK